jgi:hypothetical protein
VKPRTIAHEFWSAQIAMPKDLNSPLWTPCLPVD